MVWERRSGKNPKYSTTAHRRARQKLIAAYQPGDPCCICGHEMWPRADGATSNLHADHCPTCDGGGCDDCAGGLVTGYRGLAHGTRCQDCGINCNQHDGAARGRANKAGMEPEDLTDENTRRWVL